MKRTKYGRCLISGLALNAKQRCSDRFPDSTGPCNRLPNSAKPKRKGDK